MVAKNIAVLKELLKTYKKDPFAHQTEEENTKHAFNMAQQARANQVKAFEALVAKNEEIQANKMQQKSAKEDEKTRKKRRYREARIAAGKDPDKQDADDLQKALQERKEKAAKGLSAVKQKFRKAVLGTGVALVAFANDMKDAMWKEDAF